ncbi:Aste57867_23160 [Aphanomyces stellatus]|uniref:Aste57867_23160 protein n=1 Tax=Aphanomyces stellatus TaxID=120398 RepID=A0A485LM72_9STRA|nr:hypothetical protein As57867_023089 [Aphanomyces stellatus]VFT99808.1 Aste57867_23160 [Aphanomyces stellatus]
MKIKRRKRRFATAARPRDVSSVWDEGFLFRTGNAWHTYGPIGGVASAGHDSDPRFAAMEQYAAKLDRWIGRVFPVADTRSPVEKLLDDHLIDNPQGVATTALHEFASRTHNPVDIKRIVRRVGLTVEAHASYPPNVMRRALVLLHHCLLHGSKRVPVECLARPLFADVLLGLSETYNLPAFQPYSCSQDVDVGAMSRKLAGTIHSLLLDPEGLEDERSRALEVQQALSSRGLGLLSPRADATPADPSSIFPPYYDNPDEFTDILLGGWELGGKGHTKYDADEVCDVEVRDAANGDVDVEEEIQMPTVSQPPSPKRPVIATTGPSIK